MAPLLKKRRKTFIYSGPAPSKPARSKLTKSVAAFCSQEVAFSFSPLASIRRLCSGALRVRGLGPPGEVIGKARERAGQCFARFALGRGIFVEHLADWPDHEGAGDHHHAHFRQDPVPSDVRPGASDTPGRVAGDRRRAPEPFFEEMVRKVLQPRLDAPVIFAR